MRFVRESEELYQNYANQVMKFLLCVTGSFDLAEELTQETFYQAYKSIHRYDGSCKMSVWLCQIAKHLYYDYLKKQKHIAHISLEDVAEYLLDEQSLEEDLIVKDEIRKVQHILAQLKSPYREVIVLRIYGGLSFREIGETFDGRSESWARTTFYRGKLRLKEEMMQNEDPL